MEERRSRSRDKLRVEGNRGRRGEAISKGKECKGRRIREGSTEWRREEKKN